MSITYGIWRDRIWNLPKKCNQKELEQWRNVLQNPSTPISILRTHLTPHKFTPSKKCRREGWQRPEFAIICQMAGSGFAHSEACFAEGGRHVPSYPVFWHTQKYANFCRAPPPPPPPPHFLPSSCVTPSQRGRWQLSPSHFRPVLSSYEQYTVLHGAQ